jgi:hypothetical protein
MRGTVRSIGLAAALGAALASGGCVSTTEESKPKAPEAERVEKGGASGAGRAGAYALAVPQNVLWVPWKIVGGGLKGAQDGVVAGFDKGRMPLLGILFSPINAVTGLATGLVEGAAMSPALVGPDDSYGRVMSSPLSRTTYVWWYP